MKIRINLKNTIFKCEHPFMLGQDGSRQIVADSELLAYDIKTGAKASTLPSVYFARSLDEVGEIAGTMRWSNV